ncbi:hypothetical protein CDAR_299501 [Caerostris darwini]|uniref:Uncharacterized protein n=1 Tax=Caerostris darwini TaxID=1538125 RepID=A0AAV4RRF7_9ARAC|nr:hypothetical protein CDAR_299501 [Caerostris darwini]
MHKRKSKTKKMKGTYGGVYGIGPCSVALTSQHGLTHPVTVGIPVEIVAVTSAAPVDELEAHGSRHVVVPAGEVAPARAHLFGLHAVL